MKNIILIIAALTVTAYAKQPDTLAIGKPMPEFILKHMVSGNKTSFKFPEDAGGKPVVMEFWATSCKPCIANIPHYNAQVDKFKDKQITFMAVSGEPEEQIKELLKKHSIKGLVAAAAELGDTVSKMGIPAMALIDKKGVLVFLGHPAIVTDKIIEDLIAGRPITAMSNIQLEEPAVQPGTLSYFSIKYSSIGAGYTISEDNITTEAIPLKEIIKMVDPQSHSIEADEKAEQILKTTFNLAAGISGREPDSFLKLRDFVYAGINAALPIHVQSGIKLKKTYLLQVMPGAKSTLVKYNEGRKTSRTGYGTIQIQGQSLEPLAKMLEEYTNIPVLDETNDKELYNYTFKAGPTPTLTGLNAALEPFGLKLIEAERQVSITAIKFLGSQTDPR